MKRNRTRGILFIATDDWLVEESAKSARQIKSLSDYPITIVTDSEPEDDVFDTVKIVNSPHRSFRDKPAYFGESPYAETIYLDSDTYVCDPDALSELFMILEKYDIGAALDSVRHPRLHYPDEDFPASSVPEAVPEPNTGVVVYRTDECQELFERWDKHHVRLSKEIPDVGDQAAFREALFSSSVSYICLPPEYNFRLPIPHYVRSKIKIIHGRPISFELIEKKINGNISHPGIQYQPLMLDLQGQRKIVGVVDPHWGEEFLTGAIWSVREYGALMTLVAFALGGIKKGHYRWIEKGHYRRKEIRRIAQDWFSNLCSVVKI